MTAPYLLKSPVEYSVMVHCTEMNTGGEPVRIIESGFPVPQGKTLLEKKNFLEKNCDDFRKFVIWEPRGHYDMYGVFLVPHDHPEADIAVIFMDNGGYSTMCGHVTISLGRYAVDKGLIRRAITTPETEVHIQTPCGMVTATVEVHKEGGVVSTGRVRFQSVPSFVVKTDLEVPVEGLGTVFVDVVFGGAFYVIVKASDVGIEFGKTPVSEIKQVATAVKNATVPLIELTHPTTPAFLYGVNIVDSRNSRCLVASTTVTIYADAAADRSPCGSGTTAFATLLHHRGLLPIGEVQVFKSGVTGSEFRAWPVSETHVENRKAVRVMVQGHGFYNGRSSLMLEKGDPFGRGFLVR